MGWLTEFEAVTIVYKGDDTNNRNINMFKGLNPELSKILTATTQPVHATPIVAKSWLWKIGSHSNAAHT